MALRDTITIKCNCGNVGEINTVENDQPYSTMWIKYSLVGLFEGENSSKDANNGVSLSIEKLDLHCKACGKKISSTL